MTDEPLRILIVDDEPKNIQLLGNLLSDLGYKTGFATNGFQALELLKKTPYNLVLLDINMPSLDGYDTCKIIKKTEGIKDIPVIFLTANTSPEQIGRGFEVGGQDYITKPFNTIELVSRIKTHIELCENRKILNKYNEKLKNLVEKRTAELSEALAVLSRTNEELHLKKEAALAMAEEAFEAKKLAEVTQDAYIESEERFRLMSENSIIGVFIIQNNAWQYVNPYMANALGYTQNELTGQSPFNIVHPDHIKLVSDNLQNKLKGIKDKTIYSIKCVCKNGEIRFVQIYSHLVMYKGYPALIGNAIDVTEEMNAEIEKKQIMEKLLSKHLKLKDISIHLTEAGNEENQNRKTELLDEINSILDELRLSSKIQ